ncbi:MAG: UvrD-helicase domain-containing protein [Deltaproteobacteria bacterium]|nr:UvrD-helicase domain-containing protein [Deltaproteobacteria bacterium]
MNKNNASGAAQRGDDPQRHRALDPAESFIVQAPAGSGKTELLMQRFLSLLSTVERPEEILAVTFTKKAAGEMQGRIIGSLEKARSNETSQRPHEAKTISLAQEVLKRDKMLGWGLSKNPGRLRVQTLDSFSSYLARRMPILSKSGRASVISDNPGELYKEAALRAVMLISASGHSAQCVETALRHLDNSVASLVERLSGMLERRDQWLRHIKTGRAENLRPLLEASLKNLVEDKLRGLSLAFPGTLVPALIKTAAYAAENLTANADNGPVARLPEIAGLPGADAGSLSLWQGIATFFLTKEGEWRKPGGVSVKNGFPAGKSGVEADMKQEFKDLLEAISGNEALRNKLAETVLLPAPKFDDRDWEILDALLKLLPIAEGILQEVFAETGAVDFQSVALSALNALGSVDDPTDLLLTLDYRIKHILVDEYQDTSYGQLKLLETLVAGWENGDGRTLFLVGDPMQSIFGFREAEVGLFLNARTNGVNGVRLSPLTLKTNFRSDAGIINWVNKTFYWAFPSHEDPFTGAVRFEKSVAVKGSSDADAVRTLLTDRRDDAFEAETAISIIKNTPADETVAILCRSRIHLVEIIRALKRERITFRAKGLDALGDRPVIYDLMSLVRALTHPYDRTAWLSILRAPWLGLSLKDIHALCSADTDAPVWSLLNDAALVGALSNDAKARLVPFIVKLGNAMALNGRMPLAQLVEGLWIELGGPACVEPRDLTDAETFFETLSSVSAGAVLDPSKNLASRIAALKAGGADNYAAIKVDLMTIHSAKGLEFDHVIIPGLGKKTRGDTRKLLLWMERGGDLLLAPVEKKTAGASSTVYDYLAAVAKKKSELERRRLFYVAATRAKKTLRLIGHVKSTSGDGITVEPSSFLSGLEDLLTEVIVTDSGGKKISGQAEHNRPRLRLKRLPISWTPPAPAAPAVTVFDTSGHDEKAPEFYWAGQSVRHLGTLVHGYLAMIGKDGLDKWNEKRVVAEKDRIMGVLQSLGLGRVEAVKRASDAARILTAALNDARLRWILKDHKEGAFEYALTAVIGREIVRSVIDRTFVDEDGVRWVIDYKTGIHEGGNVEGFLKAEAERYAPQLERYAAALAAGGETRPIKKALYYPALLKWVEV